MQKNMKVFIVFIVLGLSRNVFAEFSAQEKQQVVSQIDALKRVYQSLDRTVRYGKVDAAQIPNISEFVRRVMAQQRKHFRGLAALVDVNYDDTPPSIGGLVLGPRATVIADAVSLINSVNYAYPRTKLQQIRDSCSTECADLDVALGFVDDAIAAVSGFDSTLAFSDPIVEETKFPGWTRDIVSTVGPHGDYRFFGRELLNSHNKDQTTATTRAMDAYDFRPEMADRIDDWIQHLQLAMRYTAFSLGLLVAADHPDVADDVVTIHSGFALPRGPQFARIILVAEMMLNRVDTGPYLPDINGRNKIRGIAYEYNRLCQELSRSMRDDATLPQWLNEIAWSYEMVCSAWQKLDNGVFNGSMGLKHFQAGPPPGGGGGAICGAGTVEQSGECVATIQSCGAGTTLQGSECVADAVTCPTFNPQLSITSDGITPECVEIP